MHVHILGICGTFMAGVAAIAKAAGHSVTGSDANVYPPMSTQLSRLGIALTEGWAPEQLNPAPDIVVIGNALSRGNPAVEAVLERGLPYTSGAEWLSRHALAGQHVIAIAGTHGKTTTASMTAWILEHAGLEPGFLIGGVPGNFDVTARAGGGRYFVVEADEYDTAFFDKRAKFVHYRPRTLVLNNLEFDHADIYADMDAILWQVHQLLRTVPAGGRIIANGADNDVERALAMGCWTPVERFGVDGSFDWQASFDDAGQRRFSLARKGAEPCRGQWQLSGTYNLENALAACAAAASAGVALSDAVAAIGAFAGVKRRLERTATVADIAVYDDFAHHPTAIRRTLEGMQQRYPGQRLVVALEPRSNTMKLGVHNQTLRASLALADRAIVYRPTDLDDDFASSLADAGNVTVVDSYDALVDVLAEDARSGDHVVFMSNGGFGGVREKLTQRLRQAATVGDDAGDSV
ncbi:MAG: UDP-N-acetylmuramate:L-alanyl-gamma-D-glutamyl-meso-diaminopimelate ligase [Pseudomonadota bacterium]